MVMKVTSDTTMTTMSDGDELQVCRPTADGPEIEVMSCWRTEHAVVGAAE
jgi:hypothetical protein